MVERYIILYLQMHRKKKIYFIARRTLRVDYCRVEEPVRTDSSLLIICNLSIGITDDGHPDKCPKKNTAGRNNQRGNYRKKKPYVLQ